MPPQVFENCHGAPKTKHLGQRLPCPPRKPVWGQRYNHSSTSSASVLHTNLNFLSLMKPALLFQKHLYLFHGLVGHLHTESAETFLPSFFLLLWRRFGPPFIKYFAASFHLLFVSNYCQWRSSEWSHAIALICYCAPTNTPFRKQVATNFVSR